MRLLAYNILVKKLIENICALVIKVNVLNCEEDSRKYTYTHSNKKLYGLVQDGYFFPAKMYHHGQPSGVEF